MADADQLDRVRNPDGTFFTDRSDPDPDVSNGYMAHRTAVAQSAEANEMAEWARSQPDAQPQPQEPLKLEVEPFPIGKDGRGPNLGNPISAAAEGVRRAKARESTAGKVIRNLGEIPTGAIAGVESAISHAMGWAINPLADWLNENVADLSYTREITTPTGALTKSVSEFLTGFVPALKGLRAMGMTGAVAAPLAAGALSDFAVRDPHEARLSNLWQQAGLPKNVLTDYLAADPQDGEIEGRFKSALESAFTGLAFEGILRGARALRAARGVGKAATSEKELLRQQYGEIPDDEARKAFGDPKRPRVETFEEASLPPPVDVESVVKEVRKQPAPPEVVSTLESRYAAAAAVKREFDGSVQKIAQSIGGKAVLVDLKSPTRAVEKAVVDYGGDAKRVKDLVRATIEVDDFAKADAAVAAIKDKFPGIVKFRNTLADDATGVGADGYRDIFIQTKMGDEFVEIQVNFPAMLKAKKKLHASYEEAARIERKLAKDGRLPTPEEVARLGEIRATMREGYDAAWAEIKASKAAGEITSPLRNDVSGNRRDLPSASQAKTSQSGVLETGTPSTSANSVPAGKTDLSISPPTSTAKGSVAVAKSDVYTAKALPEDVVGGRGVVSIGDMKSYVNFARINGPDDMKATIAEMAEKFKGQVDEARRGVISQETTKQLADDLGLDVTTLLARRKGQGFNAEEALAARQLWAASGEKLLEAARAAAKPGAGSVEQFAFRRAMSLHAAIQSEVIGARTETARALASWRIPAGGSIEKARAIEQAMEAAGGIGNTQEFARRLKILAENNPAAVAKFVEKGWGATSFDAVREIWINGLLSSPATHAVNMLSNTAVAFQQMVERGIAARIGELRGAGVGEGVAPGEALSMAYGMTQSINDAFSLAWKALKTGETGTALNKIDLPRVNAVSAETFGMASTGGVGRTVDLIGDTFRLPGRFLGAEDEFFKTIGYRMELHAQALRQATSEGLKGPELAARMRQIILDPPENIKIAAVDQALYQTFNNAPGDIGQAFMKLRERVPAISFVLPFVRTPVNIARYTFERTPFAPLVGQWRADIAAGGARADLALARMGTGSAVMLTALDWADSNLISGSGKEMEQGEREAATRQGWQPYSIQIGDRWYSYNRTDPFGAMLGFSADASAAIRRGEMNEDDIDEWNEVTAMAAAAVAQVAVNKTYLRGLSEVFSVMADPSRNSERYISNLVSSFVPYTALAGATERAIDPTVRETANPWEAVTAKLAGLSSRLPPRRNLWGEEIRAESGLGKAYDFVSPAQAREIKPEPIDTEIMRLSPIAGADNVQGAAPTRIGKRTSFQGVQVNFKEFPEVYDEYVRLSGYALQHPAFGKGAKDFLNDVVTGKSPISKVYQIRSDETKLIFINQVIAQYRQLAQQEIMNDPKYADFQAHVRATQALMNAARLPVLPPEEVTQ